MESLSLRCKSRIWDFIHLKVHRTKKGYFEALILIMPSIEWTGYLPYQLSNQWRFYLIWHLNSHLNRTEPNICQAIVLLFLRIYGVRHRFVNKINYVHCIIGFLEKHWRTCKRGALPNWAIALVIDILTYG